MVCLKIPSIYENKTLKSEFIFQGQECLLSPALLVEIEERNGIKILCYVFMYVYIYMYICIYSFIH